MSCGRINKYLNTPDLDNSKMSRDYDAGLLAVYGKEEDCDELTNTQMEGRIV